jgi:hypothetical protein
MKKPARYVSPKVGKGMKKPRKRSNSPKEHHALKVSDAIRLDAELFLRRMGLEGEVSYGRLSDAEKLAHLTALVIKEKMVGTRTHLERIASAYSLASNRPASPEMIAKASEKMNLSPSARKDPLRFYLEALIDYGDPNRDRSEVLKLYSRDALAVEHLIDIGVPPSSVADKAEEKGEGLDKWRREAAKKRKLGDAAVPTATGPALAKDKGKIRVSLPGQGSEEYIFNAEFVANLVTFLNSVVAEGKA